MTVIVAAVTNHEHPLTCKRVEAGKKCKDRKNCEKCTSGRKGKTTTMKAVTVASDTQLTSEWEKMTSGPAKIWTDPERGLVIGGAGLLGAFQQIKVNMTWPHYPVDQDWEEWLVSQARPLIMETLTYGGVLYSHRGICETNMSLIVAYGDLLASFDEIGAAVVPATGCVAIGSGSAQALGSLGDQGDWTSEDVIRAAYAATQTAIGCGPPIYWATTFDFEVKKANLAKLKLVSPS